MRAPLVVAALLLVSSPAFAEDTWTNPYPGIRHLHRKTTEPARNINVLSIDLCAPGISFRATKESEKGKKPSVFAQSVGAQAVINGDFYNPGFVVDRGIAIGDGQKWNTANPEDDVAGQLAFGNGRAEIFEDDKITPIQPWMKDVVGGRPSLLEGGIPANTTMHPNLCLRNPRTAVGLTQDKRTLLLAVVDGRASDRVGMNCDELTALMKDLGAHHALNFDGGGSSTMWLANRGTVNFPSDGTERTVANHLAIYATGEGPAEACPSVTVPTTEGDGESASAALSNGSMDFGDDPSAEDGCRTTRAKPTFVTTALLALATIFLTRKISRRRAKSTM